MRINYQTILAQLDKLTAEVAKNWHTVGVVDELNKRLQDLRDLSDAVSFVPKNLSSEQAELERSSSLPLLENIHLEMQQIESARNLFLMAWPAPARAILCDSISELSTELYEAAKSRSKFLQSAPKEPLTLLVRAGESSTFQSTLLYMGQNGLCFHVPNISYNQPNKREVVIWDRRYGTDNHPHTRKAFSMTKDLVPT